MDLRELLKSRDITMEAAAVLAEVDPSTIFRIMAGQSHARPVTIVKLARALGIGAQRMSKICAESWLAAHEDERLSA
ncbi:MAG TPA: helix-turn-helix transcriptional regulator [Streptosporangiaceae bacterium]|nr:helix-turn-helix transcriptional regulator [Streptosporangiaceae bacterium]